MRRKLRFSRFKLRVSGLKCSVCAGPRAEETETKRELARIGVRSFLHMCFRHNFIHGDLHPGNILVNISPGADPVRVLCWS